MTKMKSLVITCLLALSLSACSNFIYRIDIPQGNYLEQKDVDKLRVGMTKEQITYILGRPVVQDSFDSDTWYYVYDMDYGMNDKDFRKELVIHFAENKVTDVTGDFELSEDFNIPFDQ